MIYELNKYLNKKEIDRGETEIQSIYLNQRPYSLLKQNCDTTSD